MTVRQVIRQVRTDERGFGLLFGLFASAIIAAIAWTMMTNSVVDMTIADNFRSKSTAFYAADAGVEQALIDLKKDTSWLNALIDTGDWSAKNPATSSIVINGHTIQLELDSDGAIVPKFYPFGVATTVGDGTYQRELALPPIVAPGDCAAVEETSSDSGSGTSGSGTSGSGESSSGESSSGKSGSGGSDDYAAADNSFFGDMLASFGLMLSSSAFSGGPKVTMCHIPPGNPENAHEISISQSAVPAHEAHGDTQGACPAGSDSGGSSSSGGSGGSGDSASVDATIDPCELLRALLEESGSSGDSGSGESSSGGSGSGGSGSGESGSGGSGSGESSSGESGGSGGSGDAYAAFASSAPSPYSSPMLLLVASSFEAGPPKATICHVPPGNPSNAHTIKIGAAAVSTHLDNHGGDHIGECGDDDSSGGSGSGTSGSGTSGSGTSGSGGSPEESEEVVQEPGSYVIFAIRSTGNGGLAETAEQVIRADVSLLMGIDGKVYDIAVHNWRRER